MHLLDVIPAFARLHGEGRARQAAPSDATGVTADFETALAVLRDGGPGATADELPAEAAAPGAETEAPPADAAAAGAAADSIASLATPETPEPGSVSGETPSPDGGAEAGTGQAPDPVVLFDPMASLLLQANVAMPPAASWAAAAQSSAHEEGAASSLPERGARVDAAAASPPATATETAAPSREGQTQQEVAPPPPVMQDAGVPASEQPPAAEAADPAEPRRGSHRETGAEEPATRSAAPTAPNATATPAAGPASHPAAAPTDPVPGLVADPGSPAGWRLEAGDGRAFPAAPAPTAAALANTSPQVVASQIAVGVAGGSSDTIEIRLDPPELGKVQIRLEHQKETLLVVVIAERPETQDFLRRHGESLVRELSQSGQGSVLLNFSTGRGAGSNPDERLFAALPAETRDAEESRGGVASLPRPTAAAAPPLLSGSLDIRL